MSTATLNQYNSDLIISKNQPPKDVKLEADEVLMRVFSCGVCHTDVHAIDGDWDTKSKLPLTPGHEGAGVIIQAGQNASHKVGDRVGIPWLFSTCHSCEYCLTGWEALCINQKNSGYSVDGCLQEYIVAKSVHCIPIPHNLSFEQASRKSILLERHCLSSF